IKDIQRTVGITTVYVTHDQEEAMAVSDRIAVINQGKIQHIGTPQSIYQRPSNIFVATFIGRSNIFEGKLLVDKSEGKVHINLMGNHFEMYNISSEFQYDQPIKVSVRPEEFIMTRDVNKGIKAVVDDCVFLGLNTHYFMSLENGMKIESIQESAIDKIIPPGTTVSLTLKIDKINVFNENGSTNLLKGVSDGLLKAVDQDVKVPAP